MFSSSLIYVCLFQCENYCEIRWNVETLLCFEPSWLPPHKQMATNIAQLLIGHKNTSVEWFGSICCSLPERVYFITFINSALKVCSVHLFCIDLLFALCSLISQTTPSCLLWLLPFLRSTLGLCTCAGMRAQFLNECMCGFKHAPIGKPISMEMNWNDQSCYLNGPCNRFCWVFMPLWLNIALAFCPGENLTNYFFFASRPSLLFSYALALASVPDSIGLWTFTGELERVGQSVLEVSSLFSCLCSYIKWRRLNLHTVKITVPAGVVINWWLL